MELHVAVGEHYPFMQQPWWTRRMVVRFATLPRCEWDAAAAIVADLAAPNARRVLYTLLSHDHARRQALYARPVAEAVAALTTPTTADKLTPTLFRLLRAWATASERDRAQFLTMYGLRSR